MDELGIIGRVDVFARHVHDGRGAFAQALGSCHGAPFIPKKQHYRANEKGEPDEYSNKRTSDPAKE